MYLKICLLSALYCLSSSYALHSKLYPTSWEPGFVYKENNSDDNNYRLQDYSYAGYRNMEGNIPNWDQFNLPKFYVDDYGAVSASEGFSDQAVKDAIAAAEAANGGVVIFSDKTYKLKQQHLIKKNKIFIVGTRSYFEPQDTEHFTRIYTEYETNDELPPDLETWYSVFKFEGKIQQTEKDYTLTQHMDYDDMTLKLDSVEDLNVGDDIGIYRKIDFTWANVWESNTWWGDFFGKFKRIQKRHIVAIDPAKKEVTLNAPSRNYLRIDFSLIKKESGYLQEFGMYNIRFNTSISSNQKAQKLNGQERMTFLHISDAKNFIVYNVKSYDRPFDETNREMVDNGLRIRSAKDFSLLSIQASKAQSLQPNGHGYGIILEATSHGFVGNSRATENRHNFIFNGNELDKEGNVIWRGFSSEAKAKACKLCPKYNAAGIDFHSRAAVGNLVDQTKIDDKLEQKNREEQSSGAGQTGSFNTFWNISGGGKIKFKGSALQFPWAGKSHSYVIGTHSNTGITGDNHYRELQNKGKDLTVQSLYCDMLAKRGAGGTCSFILPVLTGLTPEEEYCLLLGDEIEDIQNHINSINAEINDFNDNSNNYPPDMIDDFVNALLDAINAQETIKSQKEAEYASYQGVGCEEILNPADDGGISDPNIVIKKLDSDTNASSE